jgi:hypothetical protein
MNTPTHKQAIDLLSFYRATKKVRFDEDNLKQTNYQSDKMKPSMTDENDNSAPTSVSSQQRLLSHQVKGIQTADKQDILSGRGAGVNAHPGNVFFRKLIQSNQQRYANADPAEKKRVIKEIHDIALSHGRFLKHDSKDDVYIELTFEESRKKTAQALRENAPSIKKKLHIQETRNNKRKIESAPIMPSRSPSPTSTISPLEQAILSMTQGSNVRAPTDNETAMYTALLVKCHMNTLKEKQERLKKEQRELEREQLQLMQYLYQMTAARKTNKTNTFPVSNLVASETNIRQNGGPYKKRKVVEL